MTRSIHPDTQARIIQAQTKLFNAVLPHLLHYKYHMQLLNELLDDKLITLPVYNAQATLLLEALDRSIYPAEQTYDKEIKNNHATSSR